MQDDLVVPLGGNAFDTRWHVNPTTRKVITNNGLQNWTSERTTCSVFFYITTPSTVSLSLRLKVPNYGQSRIKTTLKTSNSPPREKFLDIKGIEYYIVRLGDYNINKKGYVNLELQGVHKTGDYFADVKDLLVFCKNEILFVTDNNFYFGRRGPSIHLNYSLPQKDIRYFYNEITVSDGKDALGAYFCAAAFHGGYFGMQVNSPTERRIIFSIWSSYQTDDPANIPEDYKVRLVRKGENVYVGEFGNEGAGGQSYLRYNWKSGSTYKFLVQSEPKELDTQFSAWFWSPEENQWKFITSFLRPKEKTFLRSIYSFSENFLPETGYVERTALYSNQWANDTGGRWHEVTQALFTGDDTSKKNRQDFAGGVFQEAFFLMNCGFFDDKVDTGQVFNRPAKYIEPDIDFDSLP